MQIVLQFYFLNKENLSCVHQLKALAQFGIWKSATPFLDIKKWIFDFVSFIGQKQLHVFWR